MKLKLLALALMGLSTLSLPWTALAADKSHRHPNDPRPLTAPLPSVVPPT